MAEVYVRFVVTDTNDPAESRRIVEQSLQKLFDRGTLRHAFYVQEDWQTDGVNLAFSYSR